MDDEAYLQPGFDPDTLKVAELRGILLRYDVDFPSSAKKAQLVDLFKKHIAPHAHSLLQKNGRVRASSRGIQDVDQYGEPVTRKDKALAASPRKRSRSVKRNTARYSVMESMDSEDRSATAESDADMLDTILASPAKLAAALPSSLPTPASTSSVKRPSKKSRLSDWEKPTEEEHAVTETPRVGRRATRMSLAPLSPPAEPDLEAAARNAEEDRNLQNIIQQEEEESVFSNENPFQSASSPPASRTPRPKESRRKSMPKGTTLSSIEKSSARRKTDFPVLQQLAESRKRTSDISPTYKREFPVPRVQLQPHRDSIISLSPPPIKKEDDHDVEAIQPGEEFTPEAQQELRELEREEGVLTRGTQRQGQATGVTIWTLLGALLLAYFVWWRREKIEIGYCNVGKALYKPPDESNLSSFLRPSCEPCPPNAICKPNFQLECKDDYALKPNPLSFWGMIPVPPTCEPDSAKFERIQYLSEEAANLLREREASVECGSAKLGRNEPRGLSEDEIYKKMYDRKAAKCSDEDFNQLWKQALEDLAAKDEIEVTEQSHLLSNTTSGNAVETASSNTRNIPTSTRYLRSTSHAKVPFICAVRLTIYKTLRSYKVEFLGLLSLIATALQLQILINRRREYSKLVKKYVHIALQTLAKQSRISSMTGATGISPYVPVVQLRDQVLQHEFDATKRRKLWDGVQKIVEGNSNVRATSREIEGEILRCWCWIGGVGQIEELSAIKGGGGGIGDAEMEEALILSGKGSHRVIA